LGHFGDLANNLGFWAEFGGFSGRMACRGDTPDGHFSGRFGHSDQKSHFSGNISHFGVAATLFKIGTGEIMWA
jgi:hypothetical protein